MAYAEVSEIEAMLGTELSDADKGRAEILLEDASVMLDALVGVNGECEQGRRLNQVCRNMVMRALKVPSEQYGVTQSTVSADIYSQTFLYSSPTGALYLTKDERKLLGISSTYIGSIRAKVEPRLRGRYWGVCHD